MRMLTYVYLIAVPVYDCFEMYVYTPFIYVYSVYQYVVKPVTKCLHVSLCTKLMWLCL